MIRIFRKGQPVPSDWYTVEGNGHAWPVKGRITFARVCMGLRWRRKWKLFGIGDGALIRVEGFGHVNIWFSAF